jgi:hypothetical protein
MKKCRAQENYGKECVKEHCPRKYIIEGHARIPFNFDEHAKTCYNREPAADDREPLSIRATVKDEKLVLVTPLEAPFLSKSGNMLMMVSSWGDQRGKFETGEVKGFLAILFGFWRTDRAGMYKKLLTGQSKPFTRKGITLRVKDGLLFVTTQIKNHEVEAETHGFQEFKLNGVRIHANICVSAAVYVSPTVVSRKMPFRKKKGLEKWM